jgi:hypothetical protein
MARESWGSRLEEAAGCRGFLWEKLEMARSVCGAHVFPGGEDASVEFFVQDQRSRTEG